jgi:hypothetical protein
MIATMPKEVRLGYGARAFALLPYLTLLGCGGLALAALFGFEEPDARWLVGSGVLLAAAPAGLVLHLAFTRELSRKDKRLWVANLVRLKEPGLVADYFTAKARANATQRLTAKARVNRGA